VVLEEQVNVIEDKAMRILIVVIGASLVLGCAKGPERFVYTSTAELCHDIATKTASIHRKGRIEALRQRGGPSLCHDRPYTEGDKTTVIINN
jgi:hypothetical protein